MLKLEKHICGPLANNVYLWYDQTSGEAMIIDPAIGSEQLSEHIGSLDLTLKYIVNTHGHFDHTFNNRFFKHAFPDAALLIHKADAFMLKAQTEMASMFGFDADSSPEPDGFLDEFTALGLGGFELKILEVPGHSPGGIAIMYGHDVVAGDALFEGSIGRTDLPGADHNQLLNSVIQKLFTLPHDTRVHPGHGPSTSVKSEKAGNPFFV